MNNRKKIKLGDVVKINELTIDNSFLYSQIEYIDIASVENREIKQTQKLQLSDAPSRAKRIVRNNDILISTVRPNLKHFCFVKKALDNMIASTGFAVITAKKVDPLYIYYLLTTEEYTNYLIKIAEGQTSAYPAFNPEVIEKSIFLLPSAKEQKEIAGVLGALDDKIEVLRRQNETLEKIAQAIFKRWFVEFEFPDKNGKPYKSNGGKMIDSEMGEIPEGWRADSLSNIADFLNGLALQKFPSKNQDDILPVIKIKEMKNGVTNETDKASSQIENKYIVLNGDVLFSWSGSLEVVIWKYGKGALNQHLFKVSSDKYPKWFYYFWIIRYLPEFRQIATAKAVTMGHIKRHHLDDAKVFIPDDKFLESANNFFEPNLSKIINNNNQIQTLSRLRDTLLPKLMSGELRVNP